MTRRIFLGLIVLLTTLVYLPHSLAQNTPQWRLPEGAKARLGKGDINEIAFSPDGTQLAVASSIGIWIYDTQTGKELSLPSGSTAGGFDLVFSPDGNALAGINTTDVDSIYVWDVATGILKHTLKGHTSVITSIAFSPDGTILAGGGDFILTVLSSEDVELFAGEDEEAIDVVWLWDVGTGTLKNTLKAPAFGANYIVFSPDGTTLAGVLDDSAVGLWGIASGTLEDTLEHTNGVYGAVFSPDGATLASVDNDSVVHLWDVKTRKHLRTLEGHTAWGTMVAFSPDGTTLASGSWDDTVHVWDVATGTHKATLEGQMSNISHIVFSPDSRMLASGSWSTGDNVLFLSEGDTVVHVWDVATGMLETTFNGHTNVVSSVAFSPDGTTLASGSWDGTVLLWELPSTTMVPVVQRRLTADVNEDGAVNIQDLVLVASRFGETGENAADVNGDGAVNIQDLVLVAGVFGEDAAAAPTAHTLSLLTPETVQQWLAAAEQMQFTDAISRRGIAVLEHLLVTLIPKETALLANYPNPFNPETWIPYQLAKATEVTVTIYDIHGRVVRALDLGHQRAGMYQARSRAAYWDGRNALGEPVASGLYFYTLTAGDFTATRKLLIRK